MTSAILAKIDEECFDNEAMTVEEWEKVITMPGVEIFYSKDDEDNIVGAAVLIITAFKIAYLYSNAILPKYRRQRRGYTLLLERLNRVHNEGIVQIQAHTRVNNIESGELLRKAGFNPIQYVPDFYDDFQDAILWEMRVN
jgi:ribosomal protein S18 acetylase RimI-like enzyme